ncbi:thioredoxin-like domain-containing protein [Microscilla marina]|uniref:NHL repeat n=1 Tax=Microscilla marina ATCC 23134 TaxID=313606 RepID=A1ZGR2_MICM2|nr:thioredoxin-like domain-containing protein [Microscilla marina]EAY30679.1 NHL repeat [Microscilla marina ATCC 23134]
MNKFLFLISLVTLSFLSCQAQTSSDKTTADYKTKGKYPAPEINTPYGWLNTNKSWQIKDFRGKVVLLDFWTFGCINCQHIIPDLRKLEKEFPNELVVIGVHSAKFYSERANKNIRKAILKFGIEHPVVNDAKFKVWQSYGVNAWPTVVLIDPEGRVVGNAAGEGFYNAVRLYIQKMVKERGDKINRTPLKFMLEKDQQGNKTKHTFLRFPSKIIQGDKGELYISDSGNNRILKIDKNGKVLLQIGSGTQGLKDGDFDKATFYEPHGLALKGDFLYVADTKNNVIRRVDLKRKKVKTIAGDGRLDYYFGKERWGVAVNPNSPWDLWIDGEVMYIANAGNHQILTMDLQTNLVKRFAGSGREALTDGSFRKSAFNQPSGLVKNGNTLYVADSEASAIRAIDLAKGEVSTPLGKGLFEFGDVDGKANKARLQHAVGVTFRANKLYIADTYNGKIKTFDLKTQRLKTFVAGLNEPNDVMFVGNAMWVSDTNNHQIVKIDLNTLKKQVVKVGK